MQLQILFSSDSGIVSDVLLLALPISIFVPHKPLHLDRHSWMALSVPSFVSSILPMPFA